MSSSLFFRPCGYLAILAATVLVGIFFGLVFVAKLLGSAVAAVDNIEFIVLASIAIIAIQKFDVIPVAFLTAILRSVVIIEANRSFRTELGIGEQSYLNVILSGMVAFVFVLSCAAIIVSSFRLLKYGG